MCLCKIYIYLIGLSFLITCLLDNILVRVYMLITSVLLRVTMRWTSLWVVPLVTELWFTVQLEPMPVTCRVLCDEACYNTIWQHMLFDHKGTEFVLMLIDTHVVIKFWKILHKVIAFEFSWSFNYWLLRPLRLTSISFLCTISPSNHKLRSLDEKEMTTNLIGFDHCKNSSHQHLR